MRIKTLAGLPIEQHDSPNVGGRMSGHRGPVLHIAEGTYRGTITWQMNPNQRYGDGTKVTTSSTWIVGKNHGEWAQMVDSDTVAWCQRSGSHTRTSIELAGHAGDKPTAWQIEACAQILAWEHRHYGVPLAVADTDAEDGLGHHSMDREWAGVEWGHEDCPGKGVIAAKPAIVARAKEIIEGEDNMPYSEAQLRALPWQYAGRGMPGVPARKSTLWVLGSIYSATQAILRALAGDSADAIIAEIQRQGEVTRAAIAGVQSAILAELPEGDGPVSREDLVAALTAVLGSVDELPAG